MCRLTGNTKSVKNNFSSANTAIEWGNDVKEVITTAVTAVIQQKDNKHTLVITEMRTTNERELQKIPHALSPSARKLTD